VPPFRLGLFGGTFDPPHFGHLIAAQDAAEQLSLDRLLFVVAALPPHKVGEDLAPAATRLRMVEAAVARNHLLGVSDVELTREGPSYTVDTLRHYRTERPEAELVFLMGVDQLAEFHEWQEPEAVGHLATLVAMARNGIDPEALPPLDAPLGAKVDFRRILVTRVDISSTDVRRRVRSGRSIRYLVPRDVRTIIESDRLYQDGS
jgi:nicotinate-nucleotide adenylyltransferase